jgi:hypothetical protein
MRAEDEWRGLVNLVNRTLRWIRKYIRGSEEERPEQIRVGHEIMQFLIKREISLADALDARRFDAIETRVGIGPNPV